MPLNPRFKAGCGITAVFGAGFLIGAICLFVLLIWIVPLSEGWRADESKEFITNHLARQLELTPEQIKEAKPIIFEALDQRNRARKAFIDEDIALTAAAFEEIKPILTKEQQEKAATMLKRWETGKRRMVKEIKGMKKTPKEQDLPST